MRTSSSQKSIVRSKEKEAYRLRIEVGFIIALLLMITLFKVQIKSSEEGLKITTTEQEVVKMEDVEITKQISRPPPPPRPLVPVAVSNDVVIDEEISIDSEIDFDNLTEFEVPEPPKAAEEDVEDQVFVVVEKMPELKGGIPALMKHITYPEIARKAGLEGRVYLQFVIDERGRVLNPVVVRGIGGGCDEAAIEAIKKVTFTPGLQRGKPVKVKYSLPVMFKLEKNKSD